MRPTTGSALHRAARLARHVVPVLVLVVPVTAADAQPATGQPGPAVSAVASVYRQAADYIVRSAEQAPDSLYAFRPVAGVRTFGQLVGHIAQAHHMMCAAALGEENTVRGNFEETLTTKAALVEALRSSVTACERAFGQSDADAQQMTQLFGQSQSRLAVLNLVSAHDWEHYGNLVTYMRMNGMVPPSSQQTGG